VDGKRLAPIGKNALTTGVESKGVEFMSANSTVRNMPRGKNTKQVSFSANVQREALYKEAADRLHLDNLSAFLKIAVEEKLQRDFPDLYKRS
jgi:hypothetical protein